TDRRRAISGTRPRTRTLAADATRNTSNVDQRAETGAHKQDRCTVVAMVERGRVDFSPRSSLSGALPEICTIAQAPRRVGPRTCDTGGKRSWGPRPMSGL